MESVNRIRIGAKFIHNHIVSKVVNFNIYEDEVFIRGRELGYQQEYFGLSLPISNNKQINIEFLAPEAKILAIVGPSGTGKSTLEKKLMKKHGDLFHKLPQVTTRPKRDDNDPYMFIQWETYLKYFKDFLIARIGILDVNTHYGNLYGTVPDFKKGYINTVVVAEEGLLDLYESIEENRVDAEVFVLGLDIKPAVKREGRDESFIQKERRVLKFANYIYESDDFITEDEVIKILSLHEFIW